MPHSLCKNYIHLVFSTKNRMPLITKAIQPKLYRYMAAVCVDYQCYPKAIGGIEDHMHLLFLLSKNIAIKKIVSEIKSSSSKWIKTQGEIYGDFYWQVGYGAFSVSQSVVPTVIRYIDNQEAHHKKQTFKKEYIGLLKKHKLEYDEKYLWD